MSTTIQSQNTRREKIPREKIFQFFYSLPEYNQYSEDMIIETILTNEYLKRNDIEIKNPYKKSFKERMEDPENTSYGPFENMKEAIDFLDRDLA